MLCDWFERYAGATPRGWLRNARPVVEAYFMRATRDSLTAAECTALLRSQPPMLRIDRMTGSVRW
ncbi:MAG: hypothetical protein IPK16_25550 [Anaerolineales bacterium]|nr:hypothetical protein [Anaerolineales bacterium]